MHTFEDLRRIEFVCLSLLRDRYRFSHLKKVGPGGEVCNTFGHYNEQLLNLILKLGDSVHVG